jgi:hypothetical protein
VGLRRRPDDWSPGVYLETLARQAGESIDTGDLTKAEASQKIDELRGKAGVDRGGRDPS